MLQIWAMFQRWRLVKCREMSASRGGLTEPQEEATVHVWLCNVTDCTRESSERGRAVSSHYQFFGVGMV